MSGRAASRQATPRALPPREWTEATAPFPRDECVHEVFSAVARARPDAVAVVSSAERLTYADLDARADRVACALRTLGAGPETCVGLATERTSARVVALLAILKAGAAYLPLDASYPATRLRTMLTAARAELVVADRNSRAGLAGAAQRVRDVAALEDEPPAAPGAPTRSALPENLAYAMYTSGSTGAPKAVAVTHRNVLRLAKGISYVSLGEGEVVLHLAPITFDASTFEIWATLLNGARLALAPPGCRDPRRLGEAIRELGVTTMWLTAPFFHAVVAHDPAVLDPVRQLLVGGDIVSLRAAREFLRRGGERVLVNGYGPTETTTFAACNPVRELEPGLRSFPIGRPIPNTSLHLLGPDLEPVPPGEPGELHIGGDGVARGYLHDPRLTADRFVPDPFGPPGARVYRTGDRVRHLDDGALEFLGRGDRQVKIRGFRIEPAEVEAALEALPDVAEAVVAVGPDGTDAKRLVAYVVGRGAPPDPDELREALAGSVPEHMVPALFVPLEELPLTPSGKVDVGALPPPEEVRVGASNGAEPRGEVEQALAEIWAEVLGVTAVGREDSFFALGGDSILSIRVLAEADARGLALSLADLFRSPTIAELAPKVGRAGRPPGTRVAPFELVPPSDAEALSRSYADAYPASALQLGMILHAELGDETLYHDVATARVHAPLAPPLLQQALDRVAARHDPLRTSFALERAGEPLQLVERAVAFPLTTADVRSLPAEARLRAIDEWLAAEVRRPFAWDRAPLARAHAIAVDDESFELGFGIHHSMVDGWSLALAYTETLLVYDALRRGADYHLPPLPDVRYADFVKLEREAVSSSAARAFWEEWVRDLEPRAIGAGPTSAHRSELRVTVDGELTETLRARAEAWAASLKTVVLAAYLTTLATLTGSERSVAGLVVNGRPEEEGADRLFGLFLNVVPVGQPRARGWREAVEALRDAEARLLPHRRFPLAEIQRLARVPLFDAILNYVHFHVYRDLAGAGLRMDAPRFVEKTNFSLVLNVVVAVDGSLELEVVFDPAAVARDRAEHVLVLLEERLRELAAAS